MKGKKRKIRMVIIQAHMQSMRQKAWWYLIRIKLWLWKRKCVITGESII